MATDLNAVMDEVTAAAVVMRAATEALATALGRLADAAELADGNLTDDYRAWDEAEKAVNDAVTNTWREGLGHDNWCSYALLRLRRAA